MEKSIRQVYGETLREIGRNKKELVVLDADVSSSTQTKLFAQMYPDRFFNMGIAEANMTAVAAGLSSVGLVPVVNTFAAFMDSNGLLSLRTLICYGGFNVKLAGGYAGLSDANDGASHHAVDDLAVISAQPEIQIFCPCDRQSTMALTRLMIETEGPCYIRLSREAFPDVYTEEASFVPGKANVIRKGRDIAVFACGIMVSTALEAAELLEKKGISVCVVDVYSIKPIDEELIVSISSQVRGIVIAEEHSVYGGLSSIIAQVILKKGSPLPMESVCVMDTFTESGPYLKLLHKYGLDATSVADKVHIVLNRCRREI